MPPRADPKAKQSDVSRPAHLVIGQLRTTNQHIPEIEVSSEEYLAGIEEDWNKKIDVEIETLVNGMSDLVGIAAIQDKNKYRVSQEAFQAECRAESMVLAASSLLSITHSLKLMLLLSDEQEIAARRAEELRTIMKQTAESKKEAEESWDGLASN